MATTDFARVPTRPLSYENKNIAVPKEILIDYKNHQIYICDENGNIVSVSSEIATAVMDEIINNHEALGKVKFTLDSGGVITLEEIAQSASDSEAALDKVFNNSGKVILQVPATNVATDRTHQFVTTDDISKLNGIAAEANKYTHPAYTARSSGLYKITVDDAGHVSNVAAATKNDIIALGINATTYEASISTTWTGSAAPYTQTIVVQGITAADDPIVNLIPDSDYSTALTQMDEFSKIYRITTAANSITVYATEKTRTNLSIRLKCIRI